MQVSRAELLIEINQMFTRCISRFDPDEVVRDLNGNKEEPGMSGLVPAG